MTMLLTAKYLTQLLCTANCAEKKAQRHFSTLENNQFNEFCSAWACK